MIAQVMVRDFQLDFGSVVAWATREAERAPPAGGGATEHLAGQQVLLIPGPLHPTHARLAALSAGQIRQEAGGGGREGAAPSVRAERGVGPSPAAAALRWGWHLRGRACEAAGRDRVRAPNAGAAGERVHSLARSGGDGGGGDDDAAPTARRELSHGCFRPPAPPPRDVIDCASPYTFDATVNESSSQTAGLWVWPRHTRSTPPPATHPRTVEVPGSRPAASTGGRRPTSGRRRRCAGRSHV
jgi:hypothetical protein